MTLVERINEDMKLAMKSQDKDTLKVVRMIKSAVQLAKIELKHELTKRSWFKCLVKDMLFTKI